MAISKAQNDAILQAQRSAEICRARARECDKIGLGVLALEYDYFAGSMEEKIRMQLKAVDDEPKDG